MVMDGSMDRLVAASSLRGDGMRHSTNYLSPPCQPGMSISPTERLFSPASDGGDLYPCLCRDETKLERDFFFPLLPLVATHDLDAFSSRGQQPRVCLKIRALGQLL